MALFFVWKYCLLFFLSMHYSGSVTGCYSLLHSFSFQNLETELIFFFYSEDTARQSFMSILLFSKFVMYSAWFSHTSFFFFWGGLPAYQIWSSLHSLSRDIPTFSEPPKRAVRIGLIAKMGMKKRHENTCEWNWVIKGWRIWKVIILDVRNEIQYGVPELIFQISKSLSLMFLCWVFR